MRTFSLLLCSLGLFLYQPVSSAESNNSFLENPEFEMPLSDMTSQNLTGREKEGSSSLESSRLSIRGEVGIGIAYFFFPLLLEFQTPILTNNKKLKWLIQAGAGGTVMPFAGGFHPYFPINIGLRYDFQPFTVSLKGGAYVIFQQDIGVSPTAMLSFGWNITNTVNVELSGGWFDLRFSEGFCVSLSAGIPIKRW